MEDAFTFLSKLFLDWDGYIINHTEDDENIVEGGECRLISEERIYE